MKSRTPTEQQILEAQIASMEERWSPGRKNPGIGMDEGILRTLAKIAYEKWPLVMWLYLRYFRDKGQRGRPIEEQARDIGLAMDW